MSQSYSPTNIEWVVNPDGSRGFTANPIKGECPHFGAPICGTYCYVQREALRNPKLRELYSGPLTFHPKVLDEIARRKKPATFFMGSMIDMWADDVPKEHLDAIMISLRVFKIFTESKHCYIFLTKNPTRLSSLRIPSALGGGAIRFSNNVWFGATITNQADANIRVIPSVRWLSIEPLMGPIVIDFYNVEQIIIGAMTGPGAFRPEKKWVLDIIEQADAAGVRVFIKDNLFKIYPDLPKRRELAWMV